jgi:hypothetical protein
MTTNETPGPSGTVPDRYLEDISTDGLSANAPADETAANRDARRERNRKRNERRRHLRESLPIRNLTEALDQVESRVHTTPEQCLMSITTIARQAQGMRAGEVIAKLAEDAYFMRLDNKVTQVPPVRNRQQDHEATSRSADIGRNRTRAELPANPNRTQATVGGPSHCGNSAGGDREIIPHRDPDGGGSDGGSSNPEAGRRAGGGGDRGGRGHANSHASGASRGGFDARQKIEELRRKKASAGNKDGFPAFSARLRNLLLPEKFKPLGITKYDAKQDPVQWLRCYALSIENAGGIDDTKCLYFPFCLDQSPLTWLESLEKNSIDKWD